MKIVFFGEDVKIPKFRRMTFKNVLRKLSTEKNLTKGDINYIFCSDKFLLTINRDFLNHDYFTDIVTFDYCEDNFISGDIYVSVDRVLDNSKIFGTNYENELIRVMSHGFLHLLKYDDTEQRDKIVMNNMEELCLKYYYEI